jgi:hypothetical protein
LEEKDSGGQYFTIVVLEFPPAKTNPVCIIQLRRRTPGGIRNTLCHGLALSDTESILPPRYCEEMSFGLVGNSFSFSRLTVALCKDATLTLLTTDPVFTVKVLLMKSSFGFKSILLKY